MSSITRSIPIEIDFNGRISFRLEDLSQYRILTVERTFPLHTRVGIVHENGKLVSSLPLPTLLPTDFFYLLTFSQDLREPSLYCDFNIFPLHLAKIGAQSTPGRSQGTKILGPKFCFDHSHMMLFYVFWRFVGQKLLKFFKNWSFSTY